MNFDRCVHKLLCRWRQHASVTWTFMWRISDCWLSIFYDLWIPLWCWQCVKTFATFWGSLMFMFSLRSCKMAMCLLKQNLYDLCSSIHQYVPHCPAAWVSTRYTSVISALGDSKQSIRAHQVYKEMQQEFLRRQSFFGVNLGGQLSGWLHKGQWNMMI